MEKKRKFLLAFSLIFVLILSACGSSATNSANSESNKQAAAPESTAKPGNSETSKKASDFPNKEITIVVSNKAGGSNDLAARSIAPFLQEVLEVPVVIKNVDGAGGNIARAQVFKANPDGYTLLKTPMPSLAIGELVKEGDFRTLEFTPVFNLYGNNSSVLVVPANSPIKTFQELLEVSKTKDLNAAGTGTATNSTLASVLLKEMGLKHQYVPFKGDAGASTQVAGGNVDFGLVSETGAEAMVKEGKMRVILYTGEERSKVYPDAPTMVELGYPDAFYEIIYGFWAPPGTPADVVNKLASAFEEASKKEAFLKAAENSGFNLKIMKPDKYKQAVEKSFKRVEQLKDLFKVE